ncbi:MAG: sodium:proton antiporter [Verrucomicrobiae bacterium]|jgi:Na+/H+ antiporter NhaD/arsenite permease-like protein|nr:sodium:proton antiporter [Verrucomicrobiae bacterium]
MNTDLIVMIPFVIMLLAVAFMPFVHSTWWNLHFKKVSFFLAGIIILYYLLVRHDVLRLCILLSEYFSFIVLIGSLFLVTGGIYLRVQGEATPLRNTIFLIVGSIMAVFIGTTGASMLLIRPWIHSNRYRITAFHIIFFIFMISNIGGCLSPIGDPPLFLGYLRGVPFFWLFQHLWFAWLLSMSLLAAIFYFLDRKNFLKAPLSVRTFETYNEPWTFKGLFNLFFLAIIIGAVFLPSPWREIMMILAALSSYLLTSKNIFVANKFTFHPIEEVAWLFFGIFATMVPVLDYLEERVSLTSSYPALKPIHFYYLTGFLSTCLDNAPTYLALLQLHLGMNGMSIEKVNDVAYVAMNNPQFLTAIALGAVFFGATTYIGNGPNFMVKSIAEDAEIRMPNFVHYILCYSLPILAPILFLIGWVFFH